MACPKGTIAVMATLDTKALEAASVRDFLRACGWDALLIDIGPLGPAAVPADISCREVARRAGCDLEALLKEGRRDFLMENLGRGAAAILGALVEEGRIQGAMGFGGNQGTAVSAAAMQALPLGFPKLIVSTVASGNIRPYVREKDIAMVFSVGDFLGGANPVTTAVLRNAAAALMGMAERAGAAALARAEKAVAVTALGNTERAASLAVRLLQKEGYQAVAFHASGAGGSAMEGLIREGVFQGVFDLTPHELAEEVVGAGAYQPVKAGRLTAAGAKAVPQVVSLGGMEYLCFGPPESIPPRLRKRRTYMHNPLNANVKLSRAEMSAAGEVMAERLNAALGPVAVFVPQRGWSVYGAPGGPLYDRAGNEALLASLKRRLKPEIPVVEMDAHINDPAFVEACLERLLGFIRDKKEKK